MPYRGLDRSGPACYRHDAAQASETCARCLQAICDICVGFENTQPHCPPCAQKVRRRRSLGRGLTVAFGAIVLLSAVGGVGYLLSRDKSFDYGVYAGEVRALEDNLAGQPCARPETLKLAETMLRAGNYRGTVKKVKTFNVDCGEWPRLLWVQFSAHQRLSEHDAAIEVASRLIKLSPEDKDFWWWRAQEYEAKGMLDEAVADYRTAIEVEPRLTNIPFNLANVLERQGKYCDAMVAIDEFLAYHPNVRDRESIDARLNRLSQLCKPPQPVRK